MLNLLEESYALHAIQLHVNDYLCCKGVKCLGPSFTDSSLTNDRHVICRTMRRRECKLFITSVTCRLSPNQWIILLTMLIFKRHL